MSPDGDLTKTFLFSDNGKHSHARSGSRTAAKSKMERFVIIVNDWKPLIIITSWMLQQS